MKSSEIIYTAENYTLGLLNMMPNIVLANGCFDLLHIGHVRMLENARRLGDTLIVAMNDDNSVRELKGDDRPIVAQQDRAEMLAALKSVNAVVIFDGDVIELLRFLTRVKVLAKGDDWPIDSIIGKKEVEANGGRVEIVPPLRREGLSSSALRTRYKHD